MSYFTRKIFLEYDHFLDALTLESGKLYSQTLVFFWRTVRKKGIWLKSKSLEKIFNSENLHAHSSDASVQSFFRSLQSWRQVRKTNPNAKPPRKLKKYFPITWKNSAIRIKNENLILSNGKGNQPLILKNWKYDLPVQCMLHYDVARKQYELICTYSEEPKELTSNYKLVGIDLGQIHVAACSNGYIYNGRYLRSLQQGRHKKIAEFDKKISNQQKGSKRRIRTIQSKRKYLKKTKNRINDVVHKLTSNLVLTQKENDVKTLVIGDLCGFRQDNNCGKRRNQENHNWMYNEIFFKINYKSEKEGMEVVKEKEYYTSKTCPKCGKINNVSGRVYKCKYCGFVGHRDLVGATNILSKYLGCGNIQVVADMAPAIHVRFHPHMNVVHQGCFAA